MAKELCCKIEEIRGIMKQNSILMSVSMILNSRQQKNINEEEEAREKEKSLSQIKEIELNIEQFINF